MNIDITDSDILFAASKLGLLKLIDVMYKIHVNRKNRKVRPFERDNWIYIIKREESMFNRAYTYAVIYERHNIVDYLSKSGIIKEMTYLQCSRITREKP